MEWLVWQHADEVAMFAPGPPERNLVAAAFEGGNLGRALQERESSGRYEMGGATGREQAVSSGSSAPTAFDARGALPAC